MHIPDGFLTNRIALSMDVVSGATILYAARRVKIDVSSRMAPIMGVLAAFIFAAQMLNFPIFGGGTSGHLIGGSLLAILLGPLAGILTMASVIIAQALFLQDGGLVALGANIFNIGAVTSFIGYTVFRFFGNRTFEGKHLFLAGFLAGWFSAVVSSACCALELGLSGAVPLHIGLPAMMGYHAVLGVVEGMLTGGVLKFLFKVRPDLIKGDGTVGLGIPDWIGAVLFVAIPIAILVLAGSSNLPDPLEKVLGAAPILPGSAPSSSAGLMDYLIRAGVFIGLLGLVILANRLARLRGHRH
jgi:cobalt/nickel transport system permease protein